MNDSRSLMHREREGPHGPEGYHRKARHGQSHHKKA